MTRPKESALNWYCREWGLIPMMPNQELWDRTMQNLHERAQGAFGQEEAAAAWAQFRKNKGWNK